MPEVNRPEYQPYKPPDSAGKTAEEFSATHPLKKTYPHLDPYRPGDSQPAANAFETATVVSPLKVAPQDNFEDPNYVPPKYKSVAENWERGKREAAQVERQMKEAAKQQQRSTLVAPIVAVPTRAPESRIMEGTQQ